MANEEGDPASKLDPRKAWEMRNKLSQDDDDRTMYRPLDALKRKDLGKEVDPTSPGRERDALTSSEREQIKDALGETVIGTFLNFSQELQLVVEATAAKKDSYSAQHALERAAYGVAQTEELIYTARESEANEVVLGAVLSDQIVNKSMLTIYSWANPYLSMYWAGMDSLRLIMERGMQLPMADMNRLFKGPTSKRLKERLNKATDKVKELIPFRKSKKSFEVTPTEIIEKKKEESFGERMGRYVAETYFWTQIRGEMNTFNPTYGQDGVKTADLGAMHHEKLNISGTMQEFVHRLSNTKDRENPNEEPNLAKKIVIYYDENGNQTSSPTARKVELYDRSLDYFNTMKDEDDRKWVVATTAAMAMLDAKAILEVLPQNIRDIDMTTEDGKKAWEAYSGLYKKIKATAIDIYENFDLAEKSFLEHKMAKTAFDLSYAFAFGSFSVGDWGWSYEWSQDRTTGLWSFEAMQGDPTASGDAFTARRPWFHEVVYAAIKDRGSAPKGGAMMAVDGSPNAKGVPEQAFDLANALVSEIEQANQQGEMLNRIKKGEQLHLARFFGTIGAFSNVFYTRAMQNSSDRGNQAAFKAYQEGVAIRNKASEGLSEPKVANPNFLKTVEKMIVFVPTPYVDKETKQKLVYPMIMPQFEISMLDMLRAKKYGPSAGDLLRRTWKYDETSREYVEASIADGGKRLTLQDINWNGYAPYADDSRAVSNNFMSQLFGPLYGAPNPKSVESITANPAVAIGLSVKAADIATRQQAIIVDEAATDAKEKFAQRPSLEIIYAVADVFSNMAFGGAGLIGRGSVERLEGFLKEMSTGALSEGKAQNLYMVLRNVEDQLGTKQGYKNYSDSFYLLFVAMAEALKPITIASDDMAEATTQRMKDSDAIGHQIIVDKYKGKKYN